ncbi:unnamed protein product [Protopolystoma xenopodis]|uniref:Uncharacterized protein n=1 Tax=Protopolystoma xenopodis TaxID=117903 RepID=A0A448WCQ9_9PLAT|nr:unnamed protein product [Protopolystoma xenopodis]
MKHLSDRTCRFAKPAELAESDGPFSDATRHSVVWHTNTESPGQSSGQADADGFRCPPGPSGRSLRLAGQAEPSVSFCEQIRTQLQPTFVTAHPLYVHALTASHRKFTSGTSNCKCVQTGSTHASRIEHAHNYTGQCGTFSHTTVSSRQATVQSSVRNRDFIISLALLPIPACPTRRNVLVPIRSSVRTSIPQPMHNIN